MINIPKFGKRLILIGGAYMALDNFWMQKQFLDIKEFSVGDPLQKGKKLKFIHIADLLLKKKLSGMHKKLIDQINDLHPDMLFITGETIDEGGDALTLDAFLGNLHRSIKVVTIPGNRELYPQLVEEMDEAYKRNDAVMLNNESQVFNVLDHKVVVTGLEPSGDGIGHFPSAVKNVKSEAHHVVLIKNTNQYDTIQSQIDAINSERTSDEKLNIAMVLASPVFEGALTLHDVIPALPPHAKYEAGWHTAKKPYLYVTKGLGAAKLPVTIGMKGEVTLFDYYTGRDA